MLTHGQAERGVGKHMNVKGAMGRPWNFVERKRYPWGGWSLPRFLREAETRTLPHVSPSCQYMWPVCRGLLSSLTYRPLPGFGRLDYTISKIRPVCYPCGCSERLRVLVGEFERYSLPHLHTPGAQTPYGPLYSYTETRRRFQVCGWGSRILILESHRVLSQSFISKCVDRVI